MPSRDQQLFETTLSALNAGDMKRAIAACRELNTKFPAFFEGWRVAGEIHQRLGKPEAGLIAAERALQLRPTDSGALLQKVDNLIALERQAEGRAALLTLSGRTLENAGYHDHAGRLLAALDQHEEAKKHYLRSLELEPNNASLWYNLATAQRFLGDSEGAHNSLDRSLALEPLDFEAQAMRSSLRRQTNDNNHIQELSQVLIDPKLPAPGKVNIHYALARELDDVGEYKDSFAHLKRGADARRAQMRYDVEKDLAVIDALIDNFDMAGLSSQRKGFESEEPIFILGMPRTGTTLVERILGSHSEVYAAGELDTFGREVMRQLNDSVELKSLPRDQLISRSTQLDFAALGEAYINGTRPLTGNTPHFIDKLPFNFLYAGLIHAALPRAKIVNLVRHPMATCYAIYKQLFRDAYPFSYDLTDLGRYYVAYHRLMQHWQSVMPGVIYAISYEQVIADFENQARALVEHCGLTWEAQCLRFHENKQASTTASASQVRQPIYTSSLHHWQHYKEQLAPLEEILIAAGIDTSTASDKPT